MGQLSIRRFVKRFGGQDIIRGIDLEVRDGEFLILVGPSGCGKSTLLRMIAGLEDITEGELLIDGRRMNEVHPADRGAAMVFQSYALYPHMTVAQNMGFALRMAGVSASERDHQVQQAAQVLRITDLLNRYPKQLSGGQRQRVAIGRAIVRKPSVFLFDEPLSNLDAALRMDMRIELARLHKELRTTMVYVTHDQVEAMTMGDRIAVIHQGRVEQIGNPLDLYQRPDNLFVAGFLGSPKINLLPRPDDQGSEPHRQLWRLLVGSRDPHSLIHTAGIRAEHLQVHTTDSGVPATVAMAEHLGDSSILHVRVEGVQALIHARVPGDGIRIERGERICLSAHPAHSILFDSQGQRHEDSK